MSEMPNYTYFSLDFDRRIVETSFLCNEISKAELLAHQEALIKLAVIDLQPRLKGLVKKVLFQSLN